MKKTVFSALRELLSGKRRPAEKAPAPVRRELCERILACIRAKDTAFSYHIGTKEGPAGLTDSKFGGLPYWPEGADYPADAKGEKLFLLAQINFAQMAPEDGLLPSKGILQFFIRDDDLCGADFDAPTVQDGFRVIYHPEVGEPLSPERLHAMGVRANTELAPRETMLPSVCEDAVTFCRAEDHTAGYSEAFDEQLRAAEAALSCQLTEAERELVNDAAEDGFGHKMLGIPSFTQCDPRRSAAHYDTLLFQMDSLGNIMWGDSGVANFFICSEALKNCDFSDILYNWDCY